MGSGELATKVASAAELESTKPEEAVTAYREVILGAGGSDSESVKVKEQAIEKLAKLLARLKDAPALKALLTELRPLFAVVPKAKTAKIVRNIIDVLAVVPGFDQLQVDLCKEQVAWAKEEKRTFLRHRVELRLSTLFLDMKNFQEALRLIGALAFEVKKLDDKLLLVDIHLLESRIHYALRNMPKARTTPRARTQHTTHTTQSTQHEKTQIQREPLCFPRGRGKAQREVMKKASLSSTSSQKKKRELA